MTMDSYPWFEVLVKQAPALGVMALIVFMFLRSIEKVSDGFRRTAEACHKSIDNNTAILHELKIYVKKINGGGN